MLSARIVTGASIAIIFASNNTSPSSWTPAQPSVYLSLLELFMLLLTLCALTEGIGIAFWTQLLHGTTIAHLHDVHEASAPWPAFRQILRLQPNRIAVATVTATCSLVRGPFFQRAIISRNGKYEIDTAFIVLGTLLSLLSTMSIVPLYHGHSALGRAVSLSPPEIARAFGAPLFEGVDGNGTALDIEMERGGLEVRYGAVESNGREKVLRVEDMGRVNVRTPREGEIFG